MSRPSRPEPTSGPGAAIARHVRDLGVTDERVLAALARFDRSRFIPPEVRGQARDDRALPIGLDQTISQPYIVALMSQELDLHGHERVLEIGTGSGYQTAILSVLAAEGQIFTVERHELLSLRARALLDGLGRTQIHFRVGDGSLGWPDEAPFDRILVTAAAPELPPALFNQLAEGGLLVAPLGDEDEQQITVVRKHQGAPVSRHVLPCRFVKLIGSQGWSEA